ncbi:hypothetical protein BDZ45DRAFT_280129 [Acephala macrosclerotiorum]|nr:hypothetical protein BDZ45DRAFT_280129 [Acephala macrosclerotiorum]
MMLNFNPLILGGLMALVLYSTYELYQRFVKSRFEGKVRVILESCQQQCLISS